MAAEKFHGTMARRRTGSRVMVAGRSGGGRELVIVLATASRTAMQFGAEGDGRGEDVGMGVHVSVYNNASFPRW